MASVNVSGDIYEVTCEGDYYAFVNGQKTLLPYSIKAKMDENAKRAGFLSVFRNEILSNTHAMQKKFPDWKRFRRHVITEVVNLSRKNAPVRELNLMNRTQIINYINQKGIPVDPELYPDVPELRQAMRDYREDREQFLVMQERRREIQGPSLAVRNSTAALNPWLNEDTQNADNTGADKSTMDAAAEAEDLQMQLINDPNVGIPDFDDEDELTALVGGV